MRALLLFLLVHTVRAVSTSKRSVAIYIVGEPRTLNYTLCSLKTKVVRPLQEAGHQVAAFVHTYRHHTVDQYALLDLLWDVKVVTKIEPKAHQPPTACVEALSRRRAEWPLNYTTRYLSYLYYRQQANELRKAYELKHAARFDWVMYLRPDVVFLDFLSPEDLFADQQAVMVVDWQQSGGVNDRFAALPREKADTFFSLYQSLCHGGLAERALGGNAEQLQLWHMREQGLLFKELPRFTFLRVRMTLYDDAAANCSCPFASTDRRMAQAALFRPCLMLCACGGAAACHTPFPSPFACADRLVVACGGRSRLKCHGPSCGPSRPRPQTKRRLPGP